MDQEIRTEKKAAKYFESILENSYFEPVNIMCFRGHIGQASEDVTEYINTYYPNKNFKDFLECFPDIFFIYEDQLVYSIDKIEDEAMEYFKEILHDNYCEPVYFKYLYGHIGQAPPHIMNYINSFYAGDYFICFFKLFTDVFHISSDCHVSLAYSDEDDSDLNVYYSSESEERDVEEEAVDYFKEVLEDIYLEPVHFANLRGHIGQAPANITYWMNMNYPCDDFKIFLEEHSCVFRIDSQENVSLIDIAAEDFFAEILEDYVEKPFYFNFRGHVGQAPHDVKKYINEVYPGDMFKDFLIMHSETFYVDDAGYVALC